MSNMDATEGTGPRGESPPLHGVGVVVTRPAGQEEALSAMLTGAGASVIHFPVLEILEPADLASLTHAIDQLEQYDLAVFISPNAVQRAMNRILARRPELPPRLQLATVGRASAKALAGFGCPPHIVPKGRANSEALLAEPALAEVSGKRVVIFRGDGGRELLGDTLSARGAHVEYAEAYRRGRPEANTSRLMTRWSRGEVHVFVVTSSEGLRNLFEMVGKLGQQWLKRTPLVVLSERTAELAEGLGCRLRPWVADDASDAGIVAALLRWHDHHQR